MMCSCSCCSFCTVVIFLSHRRTCQGLARRRAAGIPIATQQSNLALKLWMLLISLGLISSLLSHRLVCPVCLSICRFVSFVCFLLQTPLFSWEPSSSSISLSPQISESIYMNSACPICQLLEETRETLNSMVCLCAPPPDLLLWVCTEALSSDGRESINWGCDAYLSCSSEARWATLVDTLLKSGGQIRSAIRYIAEASPCRCGRGNRVNPT